MEGHDLTPLIENPDADWEHAAITWWGKGNNSVRDRRYRYTRYADGSEELYDHADDPHEWRNRAGDASLAAVKTRLAAHLPTTEAPSRAPTPPIGNNPGPAPKR